MDFKSNGVTAAASQNVIFSQTATKPSPDPVLLNNTFRGWYKDGAVIPNKYNFATPVNESFTLKAEWITDDDLFLILKKILLKELSDSICVADIYDGRAVTIVDLLELKNK